ncbi:hypothetical protein [Arcanobacterium bovis]|uniref:PIN domain-containing protein n=1 Tax=Arcanobacterium bovis TaxID=2529275 RepID=A0A4Q9V3T0_9ACTO|nr:hypothetical protein [Arcanobacterium bovis]TBW23782.1 hypothetical protein EZJ44_01200 [Arcanobacterium bovis]
MDIDTHYFLDTNALTRLHPKERTGNFFMKNCHIPSSVLNEVGDPIDKGKLSTLEYPINAKILEIVKRIMEKLDIHDTSLVNLYSNKGTADPFLVATAIYARDLEATKLFSTLYIVVSNDKAVRKICDCFDVETIDSTTFLTILKDNT